MYTFLKKKDEVAGWLKLNSTANILIEAINKINRTYSDFYAFKYDQLRSDLLNSDTVIVDDKMFVDSNHISGKGTISECRNFKNFLLANPQANYGESRILLLGRIPHNTKTSIVRLYESRVTKNDGQELLYKFNIDPELLHFYKNYYNDNSYEDIAQRIFIDARNLLTSEV